MSIENETCIINFGYQLPGENKVAVEVVDMASGKIITTYNQTPSEYHYSNRIAPTSYKSARFITDNESAEVGQLAAQKVKGASYRVICKEGTFSTSPEYSEQLAENQVGVSISFNDLLSKVRYDSVFRNLRSKSSE